MTRLGAWLVGIASVALVLLTPLWVWMALDGAQGMELALIVMAFIVSLFASIIIPLAYLGYAIYRMLDEIC